MRIRYSISATIQRLRSCPTSSRRASVMAKEASAAPNATGSAAGASGAAMVARPPGVATVDVRPHPKASSNPADGRNRRSTRRTTRA